MATCTCTHADWLSITCLLIVDAGFVNASGDKTLAYRGEMFPGLGFMIKRSFYDQQMKGKMADCCSQR